MLALAFTIVPICEEALFRGFFFRVISDALQKTRIPFSWIAGALLSSLIFASTHLFYGSKAELIVAFFVGLLFCAAVQRKNSLVPAIVAHAFYNLFSIILMVFF
ncbi:CAAX protease self-immunity [uncultured archaeon]|nr:CAAX protease self-immunity [uncultured archaeon]